MEKFAPTVQIDGKTYTPQGWMWIQAFADKGCEWAIEITKTPGFKKAVSEYFEEQEESFGRFTGIEID